MDNKFKIYHGGWATLGEVLGGSVEHSKQYEHLQELTVTFLKMQECSSPYHSVTQKQPP